MKPRCIMAQPDKLYLILGKVMKLDSIEEQISNINNKLSALSTSVSTLETTVTGHTVEIAELRSLLDQQKSEISKLKLSHHKREQRLRSTTVRLFNFPYTVGESLENYKAFLPRFTIG